MYTEKERKDIEFLLKQYAHGNESVYDLIYEKTYSKVKCIIDYMGVGEDCINLVMEATHNFVKENLESVQDLSKFCDWLNAVAAIQAYYTLISNGVEATDKDCREYDGFQNIKQRIDDDLELSKLLVVPEYAGDIWDRCMTMPIVVRVTYLLYFVTEMSIDDISSTMNCSSEVVMERVNYIVTILKKISDNNEKNKGKENGGKKINKITIAIIILLIVFVLDLVLFFIIMGREQNKGDKRDDSIASVTDAMPMYETASNAVDTQAIVDTFDESLYVEKYEKWKNIFESESMPEALGKQYNENLSAFEKAISDKNEEDCICYDEALDSIYSEIKKYNLNEAYLRYVYDVALYLLRYPVGADWTLPDGTIITNEYNRKNLDYEAYCIYDFDSDGKLELCLDIVLAATSNSTMSHFVYEYDTETNEWIKQFDMKGQEMPILFFDNGTIWYASSRSEMREDEWLGYIYRVNTDTNIYEKVYSVHRRDSQTLFYVADGNGAIIYDNLYRIELEEILYEVIGNPMEVEFYNIMNTPYVQDKLNYYTMLWEYNGVTGQGTKMDLGESFVCNEGNVDKTLEEVNRLGLQVITESDFKYYYSEGVEIIESSFYGLCIKNCDDISIFGVVPGMSLEEANNQLELHGISYYGERDGVVDYVVDETYGGERVHLYIENGVVLYVYIGTLT